MNGREGFFCGLSTKCGVQGWGAPGSSLHTVAIMQLSLSAAAAGIHYTSNLTFSWHLRTFEQGVLRGMCLYGTAAAL